LDDFELVDRHVGSAADLGAFSAVASVAQMVGLVLTWRVAEVLETIGPDVDILPSLAVPSKVVLLH
jgi:hypothetical protein